MLLVALAILVAAAVLGYWLRRIARALLGLLIVVENDVIRRRDEKPVLVEEPPPVKRPFSRP